jgi:hypothetical protein
MTEENARRIIELSRPKAKFGGYSHTDDFLSLEAAIGKGFFHVSIYDEDINCSLTETLQGILLIDNSYLSSFAYNLIMAWHYENSHGRVQPGQINLLIKHNFKKFFAEQLIHNHNNTFSRAIFLETLLYEQQLMIPVIHAANNDPQWMEIGKAIAGIMGNLLMFHELGHYYRNFKPQMYEEIIRLNDAAVRPLLEKLAAYPEPFNEEVKCDLMAVFSTLALAGDDLSTVTFALRSAVLGFGVFAALWSLQKSALATAKAHRQQPEEIVFKTIEKSQRDYTYVIGRYVDMIERATLVTLLCESIALSKGITLYGSDGIIPLPKNTTEYFLTYIETVMDANDDNQRAMARLVAEAFHNHAEGLEYLYLHSKVFKSNRSISL